MTDSFDALKETVTKIAATEDMGCIQFILNTLDEYKGLFTSIVHLKSKTNEYLLKRQHNVVDKIAKIIHELRRTYYESIAPHPLSFKMIAADLGKVLNDIKE